MLLSSFDLNKEICYNRVLINGASSRIGHCVALIFVLLFVKFNMLFIPVSVVRQVIYMKYTAVYKTRYLDRSISLDSIGKVCSG